MAIRNRPSQSRPLPGGVTDPLLWRLAEDVAAAHQPDGRDGCRNLLCAGEAYPCPPLRHAQRARELAGTDVRRDRPAGGEQRRGTPLPRAHRRPAA
ncbi:hypothetical protein K7640_27715 [Micromonospora sp. PLK6-60]|uniref:hypothetical protein n=1 Tax=Micromonospora sp. PLK6-60 TaxID=2873383 RepID=UPI001CA72A23|nr:hypothetical protein [Micromonospora sp. PLK6-60]MBY8875622.1 hypothetical protein [Micromonospora sp. PLK6-60]